MRVLQVVSVLGSRRPDFSQTRTNHSVVNLCSSLNMGGGVSRREPEVHVVVVQSQENGKMDAKVLRQTYSSVGKEEKTGWYFYIKMRRRNANLLTVIDISNY